MKKNIAIIFGGNNSEHEVSLSSVKSVLDVVDKDKYNLIYVVALKSGDWIIGEDALEYLKLKNDEKLQNRNDIVQFVEMTINGEIDLVFPILHGAFGEDGRLQGFLDILGVPYIFSPHNAHALAMNKSKTKKIMEKVGLQVIPGCTIVSGEEYDVSNIVKEFGLPLFVKPSSAGSSVGISKVETKEGLGDAIEKAFEYGSEIIIEQMINDRELTVAVIEQDSAQKALPVVEIQANASDWYDYDSKYETGGSSHICPAKIPKDIEIIAKNYAKKAFDEIGCKDLARTDLLWDEKNNKLYFLEINTIPGMTATSLVPEAAREAEISFEQLINNLIGDNIVD